MELQSQMFALIDDWYQGELYKKEFLVDKNISQGKFDYWLKKYHLQSGQLKKRVKPAKVGTFKEITVPPVLNFSEEDRCVKIIELITPSGFELKIYEKC